MSHVCLVLAWPGLVIMLVCWSPGEDCQHQLLPAPPLQSLKHHRHHRLVIKEKHPATNQLSYISSPLTPDCQDKETWLQPGLLLTVPDVRQDDNQ